MIGPAPRENTSQNHYLAPERCSDEALIQMKDIVKTFKTAEGSFTALKQVTACFYPGEFVSIVGKSGSGKSTLVNMLTGIDHPTAGSVRVGDTYIHQLSENDMSRWRGRNLGIIFQFFQLMPTLTLLENVMLPMALCGKCTAPAEREKRARELLTLVGLEAETEKLPAAVSGGQQQSAAIARALANDPPILIADEPTGNLDSHSADAVFQIFTELVEQGKTILMVTHDASLARRTQRILLLSDGELIDPWIAQVFHELPHNQMLWLTHHLQRRSLSPGSSIETDDLASIGLCLVVGGQLEALNGKTGSLSPIGVLKPGDYLSSLDLRSSTLNVTRLQSRTDGAASLMVLDQAEFQSWLETNPGVRTSLDSVTRSQLPTKGKPSTHQLDGGSQ
jgi:putative ABC transport system ATP-binding protein